MSDMVHEARIDHLSDNRCQPVCSCGWRGRVYYDIARWDGCAGEIWSHQADVLVSGQSRKHRRSWLRGETT